MALTVTTMVNGVSGATRLNHGTLALDASYPSGGYAVTARTFGLEVLEPGGLTFGPRLGYLLDYNATTGKVQVYVPGDPSFQGNRTPADVSPAPVEAPAATDLSSVTGVPWRAQGV